MPRSALVVVLLPGFYERRVLAVSRGPGSHVFGFPGGHIEAGEIPEDAAHRELHEETGLWVDDLEPLGLFGTPAGHEVYAFHGWNVRGHHRSSSEGDTRWLPVSRLGVGEWGPFHLELIEAASN